MKCPDCGARMEPLAERDMNACESCGYRCTSKETFVNLHRPDAPEDDRLVRESDSEWSN